MDLCIVWGGLAQEDAFRHISYSQGSRWFRYRYDSESPYRRDYIDSHGSNNHVIPASKNVGRALDSIRVRDEVVLQGMLVDVDAEYRGGTVWWRTSLSTSDTGSGSCEVFYVEKARIGSQIYE